MRAFWRDDWVIEKIFEREKRVTLLKTKHFILSFHLADIFRTDPYIACSFYMFRRINRQSLKATISRTGQGAS